MTLRTIDEQLSEHIFNQAKSGAQKFDLTENTAFFEILHPKVLRAQLGFRQNSLDSTSLPNLHGNFASYYGNFDEAKMAHPHILKIVNGYPFEMYRWLNSSREEIMMDFSPLGVVVLSAQTLNQAHSQGEHMVTLPQWMTYALSPELWDANGKWTRFHERLHTLLTKFKLLSHHDLPGFYPLVTELQLIEKFGFCGTLKEDQYTITLPWTFPLSGLERLEKIIVQEI